MKNTHSNLIRIITCMFTDVELLCYCSGYFFFHFKDIIWIGATYSEEAQRTILSCSQESSPYFNDQLVFSGDGPCTCIYLELEDDIESFTRSNCDTLMASVCEGNYVV